MIASCLCIASFAQWDDDVYKSRKERTKDTVFDEFYNFKILNESVVWQFVYQVDKTEKGIIKYFKDSKLFRVDDMDSVSINGSVDNKPIEYQKYKFSSMGTPMYISNSNCSYNISIDVKDGRYRVTISRVMFASTINMSMNGISTNSNQLSSLNEYAYNFKRNKFKPAFSTYGADKVLATVWYNTYLFKENKESPDSDW